MQILSHPALFPLADLEDLFFQFLAFGDVTDDAYNPVSRPGIVSQGKATIQHPANRTVRTDNAVGVFVRTFRGPAGEKLANPPSILRMNRLQPRIRIGIQCLAGPSPKLFIGWVDVNN